MAYATKQDIAELYGLEYVSDLLPDDLETEEAKDVAINAALENASSEIDGHLSVRYSLPLGTSPQVLKRPCIDIAAYILANRQSRLTVTIETRYEQAVELLKRIAMGKAGLGKDEPRVDTGNGSSQSGASFTANPRRFGRGLG